MESVAAFLKDRFKRNFLLSVLLGVLLIILLLKECPGLLIVCLIMLCLILLSITLTSTIFNSELMSRPVQPSSNESTLVKKNPQSNLENFRGIFTVLGLVISLLITLMFINYKACDANLLADLGQLDMDDIEEEIIPITEREIKPPPPPPSMEELVIVEDEEELEDELKIEDMDIDEDMEIEIVEEEEEIIEDQIFTIVEQMPQFGGGESDLLNYLAKNIKYPQMAKESGISGIVYVTFVVGKNGKVGEVKVLRGIGGGCDKEAVRVVKTMPDWKAGKQRGKPVSVQYNLPVRFVLR